MGERGRGVARSRLVALLGALVAALASVGGAPSSYRMAATAGVVVLAACRPSDCRDFKGSCTSFSGKRQCTVAPVSLDPDATTTEQCCSGAMQYPWIQVCPGQPPSKGCGFCLF